MIAARLRRAAGLILYDLIALSGAVSVAYGAWLVYAPAGFIVGGALATAGAIALAPRGD